MAEIFHLPQMGQTMTEATILKWLKREGERVEAWEGLLEMMTDKANMEVEPQISGTLRKILAPEGAVVPVGAPLAIIGAPEEDISGLLAGLEAEGAAPAAPSGAAEPARATPAADAPAADASAPRAAGDRSAAPAEPFPSVSPRAREAAAGAGLDWKRLEIPGTGFEGMIVERDVLAYLETRPVATPLAAKIAADLGLPLEALPATGPGGRVRAEDVRQAAQQRRPAPPAIEERRIPLSGMRGIIARRLAASYQQAVHVPLRATVDMAAAAEFRRQLKPVLEAEGARLTYTDLIAAACARALVAHPLLNATLEEETIHVHPGVHLGIAVALEEGLTVPVVRDAHALRLPELSRRIQELARRAREGALLPDDFAGGTFTITNLGAFGIDSFDPILNPPQVAILGVGRIQECLVAVDGAPVVRPRMVLTLTFDHRALDGAPAARFLAEVTALLENPARLLL